MYKISLHSFLIIFLMCALCCEKSDNVVNDIDSTTGSLQGEVVTSAGITFQVSLYQEGLLIVKAESNGNYELDEIEAGKYLLRISAPGYQPVELDVEIIAGDVKELDSVTLQPSTETEIDPDELIPGDGLKIGSIAPDFELPDGNGNLHALSDYLGQGETVVIVFYRYSG